MVAPQKYRGLMAVDGRHITVNATRPRAPHPLSQPTTLLLARHGPERSAYRCLLSGVEGTCAPAEALPVRTHSEHCAVLYRQSRSRLPWGGLVGAYSSRKAPDHAYYPPTFSAARS